MSSAYGTKLFKKGQIQSDLSWQPPFKQAACTKEVNVSRSPPLVLNKCKSSSIKQVVAFHLFMYYQRCLPFINRVDCIL